MKRVVLIVMIVFAYKSKVFPCNWEGYNNVLSSWGYSIHLNSFMEKMPGLFTGYDSIIDAVVLSANYWNEVNSKFYFAHDFDYYCDDDNGCIKAAYEVVVAGPYCIAGTFSYQSPSIAVGDDGWIELAWREEIPSVSEDQALSSSSIVKVAKLHYKNGTMYGAWVRTISGCGPYNNQNCRTISTPSLSYNPAGDRFVLMWVDATYSSYNNTGFTKNKIAYAVSNTISGNYYAWDNSPRTNLGDTDRVSSYYIPPAVTCLDPNNEAKCMVVYTNYYDENKEIATLYQIGLTLNNTTLSKIINSQYHIITGNNYKIWSYGHIGIAGGPFRWLVTFNFDENKSKMFWTYKDKSDGYLWNDWDDVKSSTNGYSRQGFQTAYMYGKGWYKFIWIEE